MRNTSLIAFIPFALLVLAIDAGLHLYLYRRLVRDLLATRRARVAGGALLALLGALLLGGPAAVRMHPSGLPLALGRASYVWWALAFYLFVCLLVADAVRALTRVLQRNRAPAGDPPADQPRRVFLARTVAFTASAAAVHAVGIGAFQAFDVPEVTELPVKLAGLPSALSGLSLVQLTDLHVGAWVERHFVEAIVARTNALRPDAVLITGDLVDGAVADLEAEVAPLARLRSRYGTFFVTGNHEFYSGADPWCAQLSRMGMTVLRNARVALGEPGASLDLVGVEDWASRARGFSPGYDLAAALSGRDPARASILLAHQPRGVEDAARSGVGLQLSGHTHGGQIWPWSLAVRAAFPYFSGRYQVGGLSLYVSRGCGFWGPPVRLGAPPEIVRVVLG